MELVAELRGRDGRTRSVRVPCPAAGTGGDQGEQLRAVRSALAELQQRVVELLAPLVQEERAAAGGGGGSRAAGAVGDEDDDDDDLDEDEETDEDEINLAPQPEVPPAKRTKVQPH